MSIQKQWKGAYVCLRCSLRSTKRSFSSSLDYGNTNIASQESADTSTFESQYLQSTSALPTLAQTTGLSNVEGSSPAQTNKEEKKDATEPLPKLNKRQSRKVSSQPCLMATQLQSIATFGRVTSKLLQATQLSAHIENAVEQVLHQTVDLSERRFIKTLSKIYSGQTVQDVARDLSVLQKLDAKNPVDPAAQVLVDRLTKNRLLKVPPHSQRNSRVVEDASVRASHEDKRIAHSPAVTKLVRPKAHETSARALRRSRNEDKLRKGEAAAPAQAEIRFIESTRESKVDELSSVVEEKQKFVSTIEANTLSISQVPRIGPVVPSLCHDLSRVLFNPGIYQLQDPRSRVYNFDPYLQKIMPVSDFDFKILKEYITSSRDGNLRSLALAHGKKYVGSSSSMTSTLAQFHFLLSQWRDINTDVLSRGFSETLKSFTIIQRSPSSVFLRYKDGVYAMDSDKEYDTGNILMSLGKSMEKLLTQKPQSFERYRKSSATKIPDGERNAPEAYQYTHAGDFLMRAQLDAYDSRLPGTGTFDLKTRAVVSIRHNIQQHEDGIGYQIKSRFGDWESYEREYFDMMRSAFLKYSLQVRLGQMDGIFVAFHNVERIFGFQYICLPEMDMALHGQYDTTLGDQEFKISVEMLNQVMNRITERFPERSLRLQFETRDLPAGGIFMQIFAEPMDESSIDAIQTSRKEAIDAFEQGLMDPEPYPQPQDMDDNDALNENHKVCPDAGGAKSTPSVSEQLGEHLGADALVKGVEKSTKSVQTGFDQVSDELSPSETKESQVDTKPNVELLALRLRIQNTVNGELVKRPEGLTSSDRWCVSYSLEEETRAPSAQAQYRASKARRKTTLEQKRESSATSYYLRKLREMAARGAEWRKAQDELDATRKRVVLYEED